MQLKGTMTKERHGKKVIYIKSSGIHKKEKISIKKSVAFLHTSNGKSKNEFKKIIPGIIAPTKYLRINLTKKAQGLHAENCKTSVEEPTEDLHKWEDILRSGSEKGNITYIDFQVHHNPYQNSSCCSLQKLTS